MLGCMHWLWLDFEMWPLQAKVEADEYELPWARFKAERMIGEVLSVYREKSFVFTERSSYDILVKYYKVKTILKSHIYMNELFTII